MSGNIKSMLRAIPTAALLVWCPGSAHAADPPTPTPTATARPSGGKSLNEMAKDTELKGGENGKKIVITNENLSEYAGKGSVTAKTDTKAPSRRPVRDPQNVDIADTSDPDHTGERRRYWQSKYKRQVELVSSIRYQITVLDGEIPGLWRDFYAWDDPMYRDGVIKPKLDAAMERRNNLEKELVAAEAELSTIKSDARKDGAEPGWFRGISVPTPMPATPTPDIVVY